MNQVGKWDRTRAALLDSPAALAEFMRSGWRKDRPAVRPRPEVPDYARRRAALSAAFPGETLVIPTGTAKIRAGDQFYPFRPGSDFAYLTGDHHPDGPGHAPGRGQP